MDTICKITLVVTWVMYLELQGCNPDIQDNVAPKEALLIGPDGKTFCILDSDPSFLMKAIYTHQDENGTRCLRYFCSRGLHVKSYRACEQDSDVPTDTECVRVETGKYMNQSNFCLEPYNCTASCAENQILAKSCSFDADIQCQCKEGWFNPNKKDTGIPKDCWQKPSCPNAGEEPLENDGTDGKDIRTFSCKRCRDGHFKKEGDVECKPRRVCEVKAGDQFKDNECLNDKPSVSESPGNTASPVTQDSASEATTESASQGVSQTTVPTDSGTESDKCSCLGAWSFSIVGWAGGSVICVGFGFWFYKQEKKHKQELKDKRDNPAQRVVFLPGPGGAPGNVRMGGDD